MVNWKGRPLRTRFVRARGDARASGRHSCRTPRRRPGNPMVPRAPVDDRGLEGCNELLAIISIRISWYPRGKSTPRLLSPANKLGVFILRQTRLTTSLLLTAPRNSAARARRTRRVLVPARVGAGDQRVGGEGAALIRSPPLLPERSCLRHPQCRCSSP